MSINRARVTAALTVTFPAVIIDQLLDEYLHLKQQFVLRKWSSSELDGGRFAECVLRLLEFLNTGGSFTPFGTSIAGAATTRILNDAANNAGIPETMRFYIKDLVRVLIDIRNKRDVAHVGGKVSPNQSDSLLVCQCADWILTDLLREYHACPISEAAKLVADINELRIPIVAEVDGFVRIQNTKLSAREKALVILYHRHPEKVKDTDIAKWILYSNISQFRKSVLGPLHTEALIHYETGNAVLLPKGERYVEQNIKLDLLV